MSGESLEDVNTRVQKILSDILSGTLTSQASCLSLYSGGVCGGKGGGGGGRMWYRLD